MKIRQLATPMDEIQFWQLKADNLNQIRDQLQSKDILYILQFLHNKKSSFILQFSRLQEEIRTSRKEANQNFMYLSTLEEYIASIHDTAGDFK